MTDTPERLRRWRLAMGGTEGADLSETDQRIDRALTALYATSGQPGRRKGGLEASAPRVARWLGDIREFFPSPVVQVIQRDAATVEREARTERFFAARREEQQQAAAVNRQEQAKQAQDCQRLRDSQAQLGQGGTFYKDDGKGGRSYYSDEEIDAARRRLSAQVAERCR